MVYTFLQHFNSYMMHCFVNSVMIGLLCACCVCVSLKLITFDPSVPLNKYLSTQVLIIQSCFFHMQRKLACCMKLKCSSKQH